MGEAFGGLTKGKNIFVASLNLQKIEAVRMYHNNPNWDVAGYVEVIARDRAAYLGPDMMVAGWHTSLRKKSQ